MQKQQVEPELEEKLIKAAQEIRSGRNKKDADLVPGTSEEQAEEATEESSSGQDDAVVYDESTESALDELISTALEDAGQEFPEDASAQDMGGSATDSSESGTSESREE